MISLKLIKVGCIKIRCDWYTNSQINEIVILRSEWLFHCERNIINFGENNE